LTQKQRVEGVRQERHQQRCSEQERTCGEERPPACVGEGTELPECNRPELVIWRYVDEQPGNGSGDCVDGDSGQQHGSDVCTPMFMPEQVDDSGREERTYERSRWQRVDSEE